MRTLLIPPLLLLLGAAGAYAGPNEGVHLHVHGNVTGTTITDDPCGQIPLPDPYDPSSCHALIPFAQPDENGIEWFLVVVTSRDDVDPNFNTVVFGIGEYSLADFEIVAFGPCHSEFNPLQVSSEDWPLENSGIAVTWAPNCLGGFAQPVYYLGVSSHATGRIPLGDFYPGQNAEVVSCTQEEDYFEAFGAMGCGGDSGFNPECPAPPQMGSCCIGVDCFLMYEEDCWDAGGDFIGYYPCDPNQCPLPDPTEAFTWGKLKALYR